MEYEMTPKQEILVLVLMIVSFAFGRFSAQSSSVNIAETQRIDEQVNKDKNSHTQTTTTTVKSPDGTVKTVQTSDTVTNTKIQDIKTQVTKIDESVKSAGGKINISALVANDFSRGVFVPVYGASVTKEILGPVTIGAFGLTNGTVGLSVGLDF